MPTSLEWKIVPLTDAKVSGDGNGSLTGYASVFNGIDSYGDTVQPGAYTNTLDSFVHDGFIAWNHDWSCMIGTVSSAKQDAKGLLISADFHSTDDAQEARTIATERLARGKSMGLSIGYVPVKFSYREMPGMTQPVRVLEEIQLFETSLVALPADSFAQVTGVKSHPLTQRPTGLLTPAVKSGEEPTSQAEYDALPDEQKIAWYYAWLDDPTAEQKAVWSTAYVNNLPDSSFALIEAGGTKDSEGKTTPRSLRHFPHHDAGGSLDAPHVRNAASRIPQSSLSDAEKARAEAHIQRHMSEMGMGKSADHDHEHSDSAADDPEERGERFADHLERVLLEVSTLTTRSAEIADLRAKAGRTLSAATRRNLQSLVDQLTELLSEPVKAEADEEIEAPEDATKAALHAELDAIWAQQDALAARFGAVPTHGLPHWAMA